MRFLQRAQTHHTRQDSSGPVIDLSQRFLPDNTQHSQETDIHAPNGIQARNSSKRAAEDPLPTCQFLPLLKDLTYITARFIEVICVCKILSTPSFGGEEKPSVPCRRFAACKRSLELRGSRILRRNLSEHFSPTKSSTLRC